MDEVSHRFVQVMHRVFKCAKGLASNYSGPGDGQEARSEAPRPAKLTREERIEAGDN
jgi:hypothetical protein